MKNTVWTLNTYTATVKPKQQQQQQQRQQPRDHLLVIWCTCFNFWRDNTRAISISILFFVRCTISMPGYPLSGLLAGVKVQCVQQENTKTMNVCVLVLTPAYVSRSSHTVSLCVLAISCWLFASQWVLFHHFHAYIRLSSVHLFSVFYYFNAYLYL